MNLTDKHREYIERSVLCWLATASVENIPNVSPKECFTCLENSIIVANIASPQTVKNIKHNPEVCLSFIDVFIQKGFQIKGKATIVDASHPHFSSMKKLLDAMTGGRFPFSTVTIIDPYEAKPIIAPSYILFPETTEEQQIEDGMKTYGVRKL